MTSPLHLTASEQSQLAEALRVLASPFAHDSTEAWASAVVNHTRAVIDGPVCSLQLPVASGILWRGLEQTYSKSELEYLGSTYREFEHVHRDTGAFERGARLGVTTMRTAYGPHYEEVMQSVYVQEFLASVGILPMLALTVPLGEKPRGQHQVAQLIVNAGPKDRDFSDKQVAMGRLLHAALRAGVDAHQRLASTRAQMGALLDASGGACLVFSLHGRLLHCTPALDTLLAREPRRNALIHQARHLARSLAPNRTDPLAAIPGPKLFAGIRGRYTLSPSCVRGLGPRPTVIVAVAAEPQAQKLPSLEQIRDRLGLTSQQARVALLLAERRTNKEVAAALSISLHTARHHVQAVLTRLGVTRTDIRTTLQARLQHI